MKHALLIAIALLAGPVLHAQTAFSYTLLSADPDPLYCRSMVPLGGGIYRLSGTLGAAGTPARFVSMDLHDDGSVSNALEVPLDTNAGSYPPIILPTSDGGHLLAYYWVAGGTDRWSFLKTDADGEVEWNRYYPDNYALLIDPQGGMVEKDGHYFVLAHSQDVPASEGWASVLLELNETGAVVAHRQFAGGDQWSEIAHALIHTRANGLATVCVVRPYFGQSSFPQISIQRWREHLGLAWSKHYSFGNYHQINSVNELADGGLVINGSVRLSNSGNFLPFIFKVDTLGDVVWSRRNLGNIPVLQDVVEESDGSFLAVGYNSASERVIARLDSVGALIEAWRTIGSTGQPSEVLRDSLTGEHLVRFAAPPLIMRLDSTLRIDCDQEAFSWSDTLVAPAILDHPQVLNMGDLLVSVDSLAIAQPTVVTTIDPCHTTAVAITERSIALEAWPMPTNGPLSIRMPGAEGRMVECTVFDAAGRNVLATRNPASMDVVHLDLGSLADGPYVIMLRCGANAERVVVLKR